MRNLLSQLTILLSSLFLTANAFALGAKVDSETMNPCVATAGTNGIISQTPASGACGATPQKYEITVVEMGVCTAHPYGTSKDAEAFDASTRTTVSVGQPADVVALGADPLWLERAMSHDPSGLSQALRALPVELTIVDGRLTHDLVR